MCVCVCVCIVLRYTISVLCPRYFQSVLLVFVPSICLIQNKYKYIYIKLYGNRPRAPNSCRTTLLIDLFIIINIQQQSHKLKIHSLTSSLNSHHVFSLQPLSRIVGWLAGIQVQTTPSSWYNSSSFPDYSTSKCVHTRPVNLINHHKNGHKSLAYYLVWPYYNNTFTQKKKLYYSSSSSILLFIKKQCDSNLY